VQTFAERRWFILNCIYQFEISHLLSSIMAHLKLYIQFKMSRYWREPIHVDHAVQPKSCVNWRWRVPGVCVLTNTAHCICMPSCYNAVVTLILYWTLIYTHILLNDKMVQWISVWYLAFACINCVCIWKQYLHIITCAFSAMVSSHAEVSLFRFGLVDFFEQFNALMAARSNML